MPIYASTPNTLFFSISSASEAMGLGGIDCIPTGGASIPGGTAPLEICGSINTRKVWREAHSSVPSADQRIFRERAGSQLALQFSDVNRAELLTVLDVSPGA